MSSNGTPMEAEMKNINRVDFQDRSYFRIDSLLCYKVDSVDNSALFCARVIDLKAFRQAVKNNTNITNLDLSFNTMLSYTTVEVNQEETLPVVPIYYFKIDDKFVRVHERHLKRFLSKEKRRLMNSAMNLPDFSWTDEKSLMKLLEMIK